MAKLVSWVDGFEAVEEYSTCFGASWLQHFQSTRESFTDSLFEDQKKDPMMAQLVAGIVLHNWDEPGKVEAYLDGKVVAYASVEDDGNNTCSASHDYPPEDTASMFLPSSW